MPTTLRTPRTPDHLGLPPPPLALELTDAGRTVGWVRGDTIAFRGFGNAVEAAHASWVAHRAIARRLAKRDGRRPIPIDGERLALDQRGQVVLVLASGQPVATLRLPGEEGARDGARDGEREDPTYGFELRIPAPTDELTMRTLGYLAYRTLRKSGTSWAMWHRNETRGSMGRATPTTEADAGVESPPRADRPRRASTPAFAWGAGLLALVAVLMLALVEPATVAIPFALAAVGALALSGIVDRPARWWERRAARTAARRPTERGAMAASPGLAAARGVRVERPASTAITTASLAVLILAFTVPEPLAVILAAAGLAGLVGIRLFAIPGAAREDVPSPPDRPTGRGGPQPSMAR